MVKLYFKKLFWMALYTGLFFLIYLALYVFLETAAGFFEGLFMRVFMLMGIPLIILVFFIYRKRLNNSERRREYLSYIESDTKLNLKKEFMFLIKDSHFIAEILSFATVAIPLEIVASAPIDKSGAPFWLILFTEIELILIFVTTYFIIDFVHWLLVHRKWLKECK